ncbi:MAG: UDP-N-acetylmuramoyl-tripeptide--D-alanyl-D-alanine ligase [Firmicutes bacterium]|nr:UDP-N-acetylmuramoyl-tripeptide--D-alanyl-D-alanine ligase [Bacillota bacterium]
MLNTESILFVLGLLITFGIWGLGTFIRGRFFLHMIQLEEYNNINYLNWIKEYNYRAYSKKTMFSFSLIAIISSIYLILSFFIQNYIMLIIYVLIWTMALLSGINFKKEEAKKDLVFTARAKRLFAGYFVSCGIELLVILAIYLLVSSQIIFYYPVMLFTMALIYFYAPYNMYFGNLLDIPIEKRIHRHYYEMAYNKIRKFEDLKIVGITGSYGKTSTKFITSTILEEKFKNLKTPASYNTPMGISKVINDTLTADYETFVVEMGARRIGEIEEVAKLANPQIGVITSIGPTHLETYKNIENIIKTKYELIEELPPDGIAIFNYDNDYVKRLADKTFKEKILYGMEDIENLDLYAENIEISEAGSTFILKDKEGNSVECRSKLLGRHNISNLLAGAAIAKSIGMTFEEIAKGIVKIQPVPHRLQLMNPGTDVIVIDDTYNSNPVSSKAALEVLDQFKEGNKVIITPGMVELGDKEEEENKILGKNIAKTCDYIILVGKKKTKPIYEGIMEEGFSKDKVFVVNSIDDATKTLQTFVKPKDIVLFENDLPDTFNE